MRSITIIGLLIFLVAFAEAKSSVKKEELIGSWTLVKADTNGKPNHKMVMDRTYQYSSEGVFEGKIRINGEEQLFNRGKYFLPNDSTMICIHYNNKGEFERAAFTYNFKVENDSLHIYGIYFSNALNSPGMLQMNFIDEWWVKSSVHNDK